MEYFFQIKAMKDFFYFFLVSGTTVDSSGKH